MSREQPPPSIDDVEDLLSNSRQRDTYDVVIVGAGVVGCAIARELGRYQARVLVLEMAGDVATGASKANSGIVHGGYDEKHGTVKSQVARAGNHAFRQLAKDLNFGLTVSGSLVVAFDEGEERATLVDLRKNGALNGVQGLRIVEREELREMEPHISAKASCALHCPHTGITSPYEYAFALAENAIANGIQFQLFSKVVGIERVRRHKQNPSDHTDDMDEITSRSGSYYRVEVQDARDNSRKFVETRYVVNCAGLYSDKIAAMVNAADFKILPRKGEYLVLEKTQADMARHVLFPVPNKKLGKGVLVSRTYWGNLLIGPTSREPTDQLTNEQVLRSLIRMAHRVVPDVDVTRVITSYAGLRAKCDRGDFIIEESSKARGFVNVAGIDSPGLTSSPAVALRVVGILQAMNARRASRLQDEGHARLAARVGFPVKPVFMAQRRAIVHIKQPEELRGCAIDHPDPTKNIICRCERITEAEIVDGLRRPLAQPTVTSVKRRTRAGMGTCQGRFCQPRVIAIIAREMHVPESQIPGLEPGSSLLPHRRVTEEDRQYLKWLDSDGGGNGAAAKAKM